MSALTALEKVRLRAGGHKTKLFLSVSRPESVFAGVIDDYNIARGAMSFTYSGGGFSGGEIVPGQLLLVGTVAGGQDVGQVRLKGLSGGATGTITIAENSIDFNNGLHLTVKNTFPLFPVLPRVTSDGTFYKDYDIPYTDQNEYPPPVAIAGPHRADFSLVFSFDASNSYAIREGDTITGYLWECAGGTVSAPNSAQTDITFAAGGQYLVKLTVTDNNGKSQSTRRVVWAHDDSFPPDDDFTVNILAGNFSRGGWGMEVTAYGDADINQFPDNALVMLWQTSAYGDWEGNIGDSGNAVFIGYIRQDTTTQDWNVGGVSFKASSISLLLQRSLMWSVSLSSVTSPTKWYEYYIRLTNARALHHLWRWHSTLFDIADVFLPMQEESARKYADFEQGDLFRQASSVVTNTGIFAYVVCSKTGAVHVEIDAQLLNDADRAAMVVVSDITKEDRADEVTLVRNPEKRVGMLHLSGMQWETPIVSKAPGQVPEMLGASILSVSRQTLSSQDQANGLAGRLLANENNTYKEVRVVFGGNVVGCLDIVPQEWWTMTLDVDDTPRGVVWTDQKLLPREISITHQPASGTLQVMAAFQKEAVGPDGVTGDYPTTLPERGGAPVATSLVLSAASVHIRPSGQDWETKYIGAVSWVEVEPHWANFDSNNPQAASFFQSSVGEVLRVFQGYGTAIAATFASAPPNKWGDSPAPVVADMDFTFLRRSVSSDKFYAVARWQNGAGDWRSLLLWSTDEPMPSESIPPGQRGENGNGAALLWWADWWLAGGLSADDVYGAYQAVGAETLANSYVNLNEPGTNNLTVHTAPTLSANGGWVSDGTKMLNTGYTGQTPSTLFSIKNVGSDRFPVGAYLDSNSFSAIGIEHFGQGRIGVSTADDYSWGDSALHLEGTDIGGIIQQSADYYKGYSLKNGYGYNHNGTVNTTDEWGVLAAKIVSSGNPQVGIDGSMQAIVIYNGNVYLSTAQVEAVAAHLKKLQEVYY